MVTLLIQLGISVQDLYRTDSSGSSYWCSLITIITSGSLVKTSKHTESGVFNALRHVDWHKYLELVSLLIDSGLDVNHQSRSGTFALGIASSEGHTDLVRLLLKHKPDVNLKDGEGIFSLMQAVSSGHVEICRPLG